MAETAFQTQYRQDAVAAFEQKQSLLRSTVTTEVEIKGNTATFLVAGSGGATATTRGVNGLIQARGDSMTQPAVTLVEWHDLVRKTGFNIFASQGNQIAIMQSTSIGVINRKIDYDIFTELNTGTVNTGAAVTASVALAMKAFTILQLGEIPWDSNIYAAITPAFLAYLMQTKEFSTREYITATPPFQGADPAWRDKPVMFNWLGVNWCVHPKLPGVGTNAEKCFMYHKSAVGHAVNQGDIQARAGYVDEQDYSWARTSVYIGTNNLQNSGIVVMNHDGSALVAA